MGTSWSDCGFWSMVMQSYKSSCCLLEKDELVVMCQSRHASHRVSKLLVLFGKKWLERGLDVRHNASPEVLESRSRTRDCVGTGVDNAGRTALSESWMERGFRTLTRELMERSIEKNVG